MEEIVEIDNLQSVLQVLIFLTPGLIWSLLWKNYNSKISWDNFHFVVCAVIFSTITYMVVYGVNSLLPFDIVKGVRWLLSSSVIALLLALVSIKLYHDKCFIGLLNKLGFTDSYGNEDVWDYFLRKRMKFLGEKCYINIYDYDKKEYYCGFLKNLSPSEKLREVVLCDAEIRDSQGKLKRKIEKDYVYFAGKSESICVTFYNNQIAQEENK